MSIYRFNDYELSEVDFCLSRQGKRIALEPKALRVLTLLVSRAGRLVDKQELLQSVWPGTFVEENTLTRTIVILRRQLGDSSRGSKLIETVPTRGYRFIATVEVLPVPVQSQARTAQIGRVVAPSGTAVDTASTTGSNEISNSLPKSRPGLPKTGLSAVRWLLVAACVVLAAIFGLWIRHRLRHVEEPIHSLAVLPLDDLSPGAKEDYFADGMTDALITELAKIPGLRLASRTSVMQDKGIRKPLARIARELDVEAIVEGSVVRSGDRVRITAQLIDARSDKHLWAQSFEGPLGNILSMQDDVAREISAQTSSVLLPASQAGFRNQRHINPDAYDAYLRGLYFMRRGEGDRAESYFPQSPRS
jgi:TolB-like protein/DNA-binding winged helix-turn-helix (wHTH) protein